ncbi:MAG: polyprenyl synthetase family protein [Desulfovibrio sp.]|nr:polyprenyl synthetase family protein [Desulfovibrio sp.]
MKAQLKRRAAKIDAFLAARITGATRLHEAMLYSLQAGGKRLRPALCLGFASLAGLPEDKALPFAAAIEMIHTYSLIHDDLPAMDNDDFRRGKPACHKQFGEACAILAGDALLTDAFAIASDSDVPAKALLRALIALATAAGSEGMAGGQMLDMEYTGLPDISRKQIATMQAMKTGALIRASCVCGALLAGAPERVITAAQTYGASLGLAFQIADDILDITATAAELGKPQGSDSRQGKTTWPLLLGIEQSRALALAEANKAKQALPACDEAGFLAELADYAVCRSA